MNVPSLTFFIFAAIVAGAFQLCPWALGRRIIFLAANLFFLWTYSHDPAAFIPLAGFLALGYGALQLVRRGASAALAATLLTVIVLTFIWLKRYTFLPTASFLPFAYVTLGLS